MWQPDIATLRLLLGFAGLLSLLVNAALWRLEGGRDGQGGPWTAAALCGFCAGLLPPAVQWQQPDLGIVANTSLTLAALALILEGVLRLRGFGAAVRRRLPLVMLLVAILALMLATAGRPWLRIVAHDGLATALLAAAGVALVWRLPAGGRAVSAGLATAFLVLAGLYLWRGVGLLRAGLDLGGADTRTPPWLLLATLAWLLTWTAGVALLAVLDGRERERHLLDRDGLTGLVSRAAFLRDGAGMLARLGGQGAGILLLSLDGLRAMNESLGQAAGDRMLVAFAERLRAHAVLATGPVVGRLTGAQFALLLPQVPDRAALMRAMDGLRLSLHAPLIIGDVAQPAGYSLGTALYPEDARNISALLETAERAMFKVKAARTG